MKFSKEFKKMFNMELESFNFDLGDEKFRFDIPLFEEKFGEIDSQTKDKQKLLYSIAEKYQNGGK